MTGKTILEDGIIAGNHYDKYGTSNPVAKLLMEGFFRSVFELIAAVPVRDIHEIGCGEGHLARMLARKNRSVRGSDFSAQIVKKAEIISRQEGMEIPFTARSIYDMCPETDAAEMIVCCEVLEHLEDPQKALSIIANLARPYLLVSVPREPLWRLLNLVRGKYVTQLGNTPGHIQHWSRNGFLELLRGQFEILEVRKPTPWTVALCRVRNHAFE